MDDSSSITDQPREDDIQPNSSHNFQRAIAEISNKLGLKEIIPTRDFDHFPIGPFYQVTKNLGGNAVPPVQFVRRDLFMDGTDIKEILNEVEKFRSRP